MYLADIMETPSSPLETSSDTQTTDDTTTNLEALPPPIQPTKPFNLCFCPSRWLMAYHNPMADISTFKSHMCFIDTNHDGDYHLALIDIKFRLDDMLKNVSTISGSDNSDKRKKQHKTAETPIYYEPPYRCYLKVYQGKEQVYCQRLYNFDVPSSLNVTVTKKYKIPAVLSMTFNSDIICFDQFKPHRSVSLSYDNDDFARSPTHSIGTPADKLAKLEHETWEMVQKDLVDMDTLYELLSSFKRQTGSSVELTSNSVNFLGLNSKEDRLDYVKKWRLYCNLNKRMINLDTICCTCVFKENDLYDLDYQQWCRSYLVLGTEDGHIIVYDINNESNCEHFLVPSSPNLIISDWRVKEDKTIEYKLVISCRNSKLYQIVYIDRAEYLHSRKWARYESASTITAATISIATATTISTTTTTATTTTTTTTTNNETHAKPNHDAPTKVAAAVTSSQSLAAQQQHPNNIANKQQMEKRFAEQAAIDLNLAHKNDTSKWRKLSQQRTVDQINSSRATSDDVITASNTNTNANANSTQPTRTSANGRVEILVHLNSFALDLSWFGHSENKYLAVACVDRRCYCYSQSGCYLWSIREETPITCLESICNFSMSINLLAVASQSNRIDFYEINGRIVDTIYLGKQDYATVLRFGRYGREDNCLCIVTKLGHLRILILKRMAKFADGQCVTSALLAEQQHQQLAEKATDQQQQLAEKITNQPRELSTHEQQQQQQQQHANNNDATNTIITNLVNNDNVTTSQHQPPQSSSSSAAATNDAASLLDDATNGKRIMMQIMSMAATNQQQQQHGDNLKTSADQSAGATSARDIGGGGKAQRAPLKIPAKPRSFVDQLTEQADCSLGKSPVVHYERGRCPTEWRPATVAGRHSVWPADSRCSPNGPDHSIMQTNARCPSHSMVIDGIKRPLLLLLFVPPQWQQQQQHSRRQWLGDSRRSA